MTAEEFNARVEHARDVRREARWERRDMLWLEDRRIWRCPACGSWRYADHPHACPLKDAL